MIEELKEHKRTLIQGNTIFINDMTICFNKNQSELLQSDLGFWIFNIENNIMPGQQVWTNLINRITELIKFEMQSKSINCPQCGGTGEEELSPGEYILCGKCLGSKIWHGRVI